MISDWWHGMVHRRLWHTKFLIPTPAGSLRISMNVARILTFCFNHQDEKPNASYFQGSKNLPDKTQTKHTTFSEKAPMPRDNHFMKSTFKLHQIQDDSSTIFHTSENGYTRNFSVFKACQ